MILREVSADVTFLALPRWLTVTVDRTSELRHRGFSGRRLGPKQMTTDTAVRVTRMVVEEKGLATCQRFGLRTEADGHARYCPSSPAG